MEMNQYEIREFARATHMSIQDATEVCEILAREKANGNHRLRRANLDTVEGYIEEWYCSWFRYKTWEMLIQCDSEARCKEQINQSIFRLSSGMYIQTVF
jgi:hypothetical protein